MVVSMRLNKLNRLLSRPTLPLNVVGILATLLFFPNCAGYGKGNISPPGPWAPEDAEVRLVMEGDAAAPMRLVTNDSPTGDRALRRKCRPVKGNGPVITRLIERMLVTVKNQEGVGIAAPQVGVNRRLILVQRLDKEPETPFVAYRNPEITRMSKATVVGWEGCLSIPAGFGRVRRARSIVIAFDDAGGNRCEEKVKGFTARIFQHEIDHLDGVLFIDRMEPGALLPEAAYRKLRQQEKQGE